MNRLSIILLFILFQFKIEAQLGFENLPELEGASISYMARDLWSGKLIAGYDTAKVLAPASVLKLFTTGLALNELGGKTTIKSTFYFTGKIENGVLKGDLIFDGNFNPTILAQRYNRSLSKFTDKLVNDLKRKGIQSIEGDVKVMGDDSQVSNVPRTWIWEDIGNYYGAGSSRTVMNENILKIYLKSGGVGSVVELVSTEPSLPWLQIDNKVISSKINRDLAYCFSRPGDEKISMTGSIPANRSSFLVKASLPEPARTFATALKESLEKKGVKVGGSPLAVDFTLERLKVLLTMDSPSISSIVRKTNKHSINVYAESLLNFTYTKSGEKDIGRTEYLKKTLGKYFDTKTMKLYDGCGLSRFNSVSSKQVVDLITWMNKHNQRDAFFNSFAVAGESGTLKSILGNTAAKGRIKGKSGSMDGVRAYAGTINTRKGENLAFSVMVNNYNISNTALKNILEKWLWELWTSN